MTRTVVVVVVAVAVMMAVATMITIVAAAVVVVTMVVVAGGGGDDGGGDGGGDFDMRVPNCTTFCEEDTPEATAASILPFNICMRRDIPVQIIQSVGILQYKIFSQ